MIRICPTCGQTQHLERHGKGALFVHSNTRQMTCSPLAMEDHDYRNANTQKKEGRRGAEGTH